MLNRKVYNIKKFTFPGTLTEDGLDLWGVVPVKFDQKLSGDGGEAPEFAEPEQDPSQLAKVGPSVRQLRLARECK